MTHLFIAKLLVPQRPTIAIRRTELLSRLEATPAGGIGLLRAPAGYGKTCLLTDLANESSGAICWVSLDEWDRDPAVFLGYLRESVRRALGEEQLSDGAEYIEPRESLAEISDQIAAANSRVDVILDDVHELEGADSVLELIGYFAQRLPPNCRLLLASRTNLPLDAWPRLVATGRVVELVADDLLMTTKEVQDLWKTGGHEPIEWAALDALTRATRGWPVAIAMAVRNGQPEIPVVQERLSDYLLSEVLAKLPVATADFLERTSVLEILGAERCAAVAGRSLGEMEEILSGLPTLNIPATVVSSQPREVRLHPLVREMLEARLRTRDRAAFEEGHRKAAELDLARDEVGGALAHLASADRWDELAALIAAEAPRAYQAGRWHSVATWLDLLPSDRLLSNASLGIWQARILVRLGQCDQALSSIAETLAACRDISADARAALETIRSAALRTRGEIGAAVRAGEVAKRLAFEANAPVEVVADARKELGLSLISQGAFEDGIEELKAALEMQQFRGDASDIAFLSGCLGSAYGGIGRLGESVAFLEQARARFGSLRNSKELSWVLNNLGVIYFFFGNIEKAKTVLGECLATSRAGAHRRAEGFALTSLADIDRLLGDTNEGRERYEAVITIAEEVNDVSLGTLALIGLADLERRAGRSQAAETLARRSVASAESRMAKSEEALARLTLSRLARQMGTSEEALAESQAALSLLGSEGVARDLGEALLCRAEILIDLRSHRGELNATLRHLDDVIARLGHGSFILYSDRALDILRYAVARRISDSYRDLLRRLEPEASDGGEPSATYPIVEVTALGGFSVTVGNRPLEAVEWESEKARELFLLLLSVGRPLTRDEIIVNLWPDAERKKATSVFHSTLHRARRALYPQAIVEAGGWYSLQPEAAFLSDIGKFLDLVGSSRIAEANEERLTEAVDIYGGQFAPDLFSDWAEETRRILQERFLTVALQLGRLLNDNGDYGAASAAFERALTVDSLNEEAWYGLVLSHAGLGGRARAVRTFRRYAQLLETELGEMPTGRIAALYRQLSEHRRAAS